MRDEIDYWNSDAGPRWAADADRLDRQLEPIGAAVLDMAELGAGQRVLDVGCGAGWLTDAAARRVAPGGAVLGVDVSEPLLAVARRRAADTGRDGVEYARGDAQTHDLTSSRYDRVISRFGVMFFADSAAALRNLAGGLDRSGRLALACWARPEDNPWMAVPRAATARIVELPPITDPAIDDEPGPFRLADEARTIALFERSGFDNVTIGSSGGQCLVGGGGDLDQAVDFCCRVGPAAAAHRDADPPTRERLRGELRDALAPYQTSDGVRMNYRALIVTATPRGR